MKTSFPEVRARYTLAPSVHLLEGWQSITTGRKKTVRKTSWRNRLGKKHGILSGRRSATSTFLIQDSFQAISILAKAACVCTAATLHPNITPRRNSAVASVTGVVNTTNLPAKAACVWGYYNVITMWMPPVVSCSPNQRTFVAATLKMTDVSLLLRLFNWGWWSQSRPPNPDYNKAKRHHGARVNFLFKSNLALLISLCCCV